MFPHALSTQPQEYAISPPPTAAIPGHKKTDVNNLQQDVLQQAVKETNLLYIQPRKKSSKFLMVAF